MVKVLDKDGKILPSDSRAGLRRERIKNLVTINSHNFVIGETDDVHNLQDLKKNLKSAPGNPFGMHLEKGHANPQVQHDCITIRGTGFMEAKALGRLVIFYSPSAIEATIKATKDKKILATISERYKFLQDLPRKATYY